MKKIKVKKTDAKKADARKPKAGKKNTLLSGAARSIKKLGKKSGLSKLTTTQKVVGGTALVALGLSLLAKRQLDASASPDTPDAAAAEDNLQALGHGDQ